MAVPPRSIAGSVRPVRGIPSFGKRGVGMDRDWLNRNIAPIIAGAIVLFTFGLFLIYSLGKIDPANKDVMLIVIGSVTTTLATVVSYFFGSSQGSSRKTEILAGQPVPPAYREALISPVSASAALPFIDAGPPEAIKPAAPAPGV